MYPTKILPIHFKRETKSNIHYMFTFYKYVEWILGLKLMNIENISELEKKYKFFIFFFMTFMSINIILRIFTHIKFMERFGLPIFITAILSYITIVIEYIFVIIHGCFFSSKNAVQIYIKMTNIDKILKLVNYDQFKVFRETFISLHVIYIAFRLYQIMSYFKKIPIDMMTILHIFSTITVDLKMLNFGISINMIARRFEMLNKLMVKLKNNILTIDYDLNNGILTNVWRENDKNIKNVKLDISKYLAVYNTLTDVIDEINALFGVPVSILFYL